MPLLKAYPLVVGLAGLPLALASGAWSLGFGHWRQLAGFCLKCGNAEVYFLESDIICILMECE
eukprot:1161921-Pelagomonas_calceolata.AAC.1